MTSFFWSTLLLVATGATGATARKEFSYDVILFGVPCYWLPQVLQVLQLARRLEFNYDVILFGVPCYWFATGATARKKFNYDVILLEYLATGLLQVLQVLQLARSLAMTSFFWSTLLLVATGATGATARKETGVQLRRHSFGVPCYWFATGATARMEFSYDVIFWSTLLLVCYRCYRCYSSQGV